MMKTIFTSLIILLFIYNPNAQSYTYLKADRLFDGEILHEKWGVLIKDNTIEIVDNQLVIEKNLPKDTKVLDYKNATLLPGLIEVIRTFYCIRTMKQIGMTKC
jgi:cytosine/adenosine deaminase-related metal-dependent hydrolase